MELMENLQELLEMAGNFTVPFQIKICYEVAHQLDMAYDLDITEEVDSRLSSGNSSMLEGTIVLLNNHVEVAMETEG